MGRYIDADAFKRKLADKDIFFPALYENELNETPTADVEEVKHGVWVGVNHTGNSKRGRHIKYTTNKCSVCGYCNGRRRTKRCPNCGAKMDGVKGE